MLSIACSSKSSGAGADGNVAAGMAALSKYACVSCHTQDLSGSSTPYAGTRAYPANLTPDPETGIGEWDEDTIVKAILSGIDDEGSELCTTMPRFGNMQMTMEEARAIAAYLRSLPPVKKKVPESECSNGSERSGERGASSMAGAGAK
jgi:mono/diheme cytochrome c family protein